MHPFESYLREIRDIARRIAAILQLEPVLDAGYGAVKGEANRPAD